MEPRGAFAQWTQVRADLLATLDQFSDDDLRFVPFDGSWTVGRIALHIADAEEGWLRYVVTRELDRWPDHFQLERYPTRDAIKVALTEVHGRTEDYLAGLTEGDLGRVVEMPWGASAPLGWIFWHVLEHEVHHRGELSLILGMLGRPGLEV